MSLPSSSSSISPSQSNSSTAVTLLPPPTSPPPTTASPTSPPPTVNPSPPTTQPPPPPPSSEPPTSPPPSTSPPTSPPPSTSSSPPSTTNSQPPTSPPPSSTTDATHSSTLSLTNATVTPSTSVMNSVVVSTTNGQAFTTTVQVTSIFSAPAVITAPPSGADDNGGGSNHTGAIVGGVVGGVVGGLAVLVLLVWIILRKRRRAKLDEFDGNFDPARVVSSSGPNRLNLDEEDTPAAAGITPYPYPEQYHSQRDMAQVPFGSPHHPSSSTSASPPPHPPLPPGASSPSPNSYSAYNQSYNQTSPASDGGYTTTSSGLPYPSPVPSPGIMGGSVAAAALLGRGGPSPGPSVNLPPSEFGSSGSHSGHGHSGSGGYGSGGYYNAFGDAAGRMSNKDREAYEAAGPSGRMVVTNNPEQPYPQYPSYTTGPSSATPRAGTPQQQQRGEKSQVNLSHAASSSVIVHQDGGRVPQSDEEEAEREIPPTYDSIPRDQR